MIHSHSAKVRSMISDEELDAWQKLADDATAGPWEWGDYRDGHGLEGRLLSRASSDPKVILRPVATSWEGDYEIEYEEQDGAFIASSRTIVPALIAEVRRLRLVATPRML